MALQAFILAKIRPGMHGSAIKKIKALKEITRATKTLGKFDLFMECEAASSAELNEFVFDTLNEIKDIESMRIMFSAYSFSREQPAPVAAGKAKSKRKE